METFPETSPMKKSLRMLFKNKTSLLHNFVEEKGGNLEFSFPIPVIKRGKGQFIYDYDGNRYLDLFLSDGDLIIGHAHPQLTKILKSWLGRGYAANYPQVGLEMLANKLEATFFEGTVHDSENKKWFFFPSYESSVVFLLRFMKLRSIYKGGFYYFFYSDSCKEGETITPHMYAGMKSINLAKHNAERDNPPGIGSIENAVCMIYVDQFLAPELLGEILALLRKRNNYILSIEREFCSYLILRGRQNLLNLIDGRILGSWVTAGLPVTAVYFRSFHRISRSSVVPEELIQLFDNLLWVPPLYLIKATIRSAYLVNRFGGIKRYIEKISHFYSSLDEKYFNFRDGCIHMWRDSWVENNWKDLYLALLKKGVFLSPHPGHPIYVSLVHDDEALKKYARRINSIFAEYRR